MSYGGNCFAKHGKALEAVNVAEVDFTGLDVKNKLLEEIENVKKYIKETDDECLTFKFSGLLFEISKQEKKMDVYSFV